MLSQNFQKTKQQVQLLENQWLEYNNHLQNLFFQSFLSLISNLCENYYENIPALNTESLINLNHRAIYQIKTYNDLKVIQNLIARYSALIPNSSYKFHILDTKIQYLRLSLQSQKLSSEASNRCTNRQLIFLATMPKDIVSLEQIEDLQKNLSEKGLKTKLNEYKHAYSLTTNADLLINYLKCDYLYTLDSDHRNNFGIYYSVGMQENNTIVFEPKKPLSIILIQPKQEVNFKVLNSELIKIDGIPDEFVQKHYYAGFE